ncbi:MAG TPA: hypothetical protein VFS40_04645 [Gemmatimonadales bacterium]|nr:hypothetical protein [Gemmatimonadales bacterium]
MPAPRSPRLARLVLALTLASLIASPLAAQDTAKAKPKAPPKAPSNAAKAASTALPYVQARNDSVAGAYLTLVGGCNDCHTEGWDTSNGKVPDAERLAGTRVGYRGPWGTTYAANLRLIAQRASEERWVQILTTADSGHGKPPMPWMNTAQMNPRDLRAIYRYIRSLGARGERTPRFAPPDSTPRTPYINFVPVNPDSGR